MYVVGGNCTCESLPDIPTHLGGARRRWPLTGVAVLASTEAAATFSTMMVFVRCTKKVRHKLGHASDIASHAGRCLYVLMGGARKKERLTSSPARKDVTGARCWKRIACPEPLGAIRRREVQTGRRPKFSPGFRSLHQKGQT